MSFIKYIVGLPEHNFCYFLGSDPRLPRESEETRERIEIKRERARESGESGERE